MKTKPTSRELCVKIKEDALEFTKKNLEMVQYAYYDVLWWNQSLKEAGLDWLPDPEDTSGEEEILFEWMVKAFVHNGREEAQVRAALATVRAKVLEQEDLGP